MAAAATANGTAAAVVGSARLTLQQLAAYDGSDASKPLYIAVRGKIYDVSAGRSFYGPGGWVGGERGGGRGRGRGAEGERERGFNLKGRVPTLLLVLLHSNPPWRAFCCPFPRWFIYVVLIMHQRAALATPGELQAHLQSVALASSD